jgi:hydrogenase expression/formation protein HypC
MCIEDPARVVSVDGEEAVVEIGGRRRVLASLLVPDVGPGDWVTVLAGTIVERLDPDEGAEIVERLRAAERGEPAAPPRSRAAPSAPSPSVKLVAEPS